MADMFWEIHKVRKGLWAFCFSWLWFSDADWLGWQTASTWSFYWNSCCVSITCQVSTRRWPCFHERFFKSLNWDYRTHLETSKKITLFFSLPYMGVGILQAPCGFLRQRHIFLPDTRPGYWALRGLWHAADGKNAQIWNSFADQDHAERFIRATMTSLSCIMCAVRNFRKKTQKLYFTSWILVQ